MKDPAYTTLARYLFDAWVAYHMGVSPRTASKYFPPDLDLEDFWFEVAEAVDKAMAQRPNPWLAVEPKQTRPQRSEGAEAAGCRDWGEFRPCQGHRPTEVRSPPEDWLGWVCV